MKKKKDQWEEEVKNHFVAELKAQGRGEWIVVDSDVVVDAQTNQEERNMDYCQACRQTFIYRITEGLSVTREQRGSVELVRSPNECIGDLVSNGVRSCSIHRDG
jgi:hypothetical protein